MILCASGLVAEGVLASSAAAFLRVASDGPRLSHVLVDFTDVAEFRIGRQELFALAFDERLMARMQSKAAVAIAASRDHVFGLARSWQSLVANRDLRVRVFRGRVAATEWLDKVVRETKETGGESD